METSNDLVGAPTMKDEWQSDQKDDCEDTEPFLEQFQQQPWIFQGKRRMRHYVYALLTVSLIAVVEFVLLAQNFKTKQCSSPTPYGLSYARTVERTMYLDSKYTSKSEEVASEAWKSILAGHGVVALEADYIAEKSLPPSTAIPGSDGKFMYLIEAYHTIHCLQSIRAHYKALEQGNPWNWTKGHDDHCFDALRQYIMCNIDDTPLWTTGHRESGVGQVKKCNDWDALRDWAEARSANYFDVEPGMGIRHLNNYHEGDGLTW
ncbi:unnamed protein product [Periconia digitata]|uniref:Cyclochlorotine biosynthesis protein O n=1 Tax=Periconia digitata TaxID=1303443 RepID=A0A9W4U4W1_9PLEO|nr:unnamed protein product [Periconia digitata]